MVKIGDVELTDDEFNIIQKNTHLIKEIEAKRPAITGKTATSARIYVKKEWCGGRVILLLLK